MLASHKTRKGLQYFDNISTPTEVCMEKAELFNNCLPLRQPIAPTVLSEEIPSCLRRGKKLKKNRVLVLPNKTIQT